VASGERAGVASGEHSEHRESELAVVGAGAAGLYAALCAARAGARSLLISATPLAQTASYWAQGGLAAAIAPEDSPERHLEDTERAGRGAVRRTAAEVLVHEAPERLRDLRALGLRFDGDRLGALALGLEGGHSVRRVVHAGGGATGRRMLRQLSALAVGEPLIEILEGEQARAATLLIEAGRCTGVVCQSGLSVTARAVILATGGAAALWSRTTNPPGSFGAGTMLAHAAGAALADLELVQFHPTAVRGVRGREGFLITEAIRGEGATLHDREGERFVDELAPRDEVSRAIQRKMAETGADSVGLDMRGIDPASFPNVFAALHEAGVDPARELVPVAPAAHYTIGGVRTDLEARSTVPGLYAVGEVSCSGLHGANRLASNSLSECFVFAARGAKAALDEPAGARRSGVAGGGAHRDGSPRDPRWVAAPTAETRAAMWRDAGIERDAEGLRELLGEPHPLAALIARSALAREESRGVHARSDFPACDPALDRSHLVVLPGEEPRWERWE
jgi:L-aspartate oxidase